MIQQGSDKDSPVMNETLSVIDEHITDMKIPCPGRQAIQRKSTNDSDSEYSTHVDNRLSYITGHETDEEERNLHTEQEVSNWTPTQVAEYLGDIGVESRHCEIFREQEISGEVLLTMDQSSIFMKEFDLGLVGRRLRTWHKIKALQEEVRGIGSRMNNTRNRLDSNASSDEFGSNRTGSATGSTFSTNLFKQPSPTRPYQREEFSNPQSSPSPQLPESQRYDAGSRLGSFALNPGLDGSSRPSAASIRELNHSRRHSAADFTTTFTPSTPTEQITPLPNNNATTSLHQKTPSFDRNWTMGSTPPMTIGRPRSATSSSLHPGTDRNTFDPRSSEAGHAYTLSTETDRGYLSGGEMEGRKARNVLRKRDTVSANHSRQSSYQTDTKRMSFAGAMRHSRFGSVDSIKDTVAAMASPKVNFMSHFRNSSANAVVVTETSSPDVTSPAVTKLEYNGKPSMKIATSTKNPSSSPASSSSTKSPLASTKSLSKPRTGLRAISDAVTGNERALASTPSSAPSPIKEFAVQSPTRTGSTTPSGASQSIELESTDTSSKDATGVQTGLTPTSGTRRKSKKETSAYIRGLEHKPPQEQMEGCDYSGWMKKKSSNIMATWKPRLFVLRGRRLSYYYSETDTQEKGLIDISTHRVLPADHDIITGFHATVTGAKSSPVSPATAHIPTLASEDAAAQSESTLQKSNSDSMFIFKLVPPRSGLSRTVNFTKPTVHYFAVDNVTQGRLWMAALMKATIDRDETKPVTTTYQQKTISLMKARAMKHRPPALMNLEENPEGIEGGAKSDETGLNIQGLDFNKKVGSLDYKRTGSWDDVASTGPSEEEEKAGRIPKA